MSKLAGMAGGQTLGIASVAAAAVVGGGLYVAGVFTPEPSNSEPEPVVLVESQDEQTAQAEQSTEPQTETAAPEETIPEVIEATPRPASAPNISTFRLEADGQMLISGTSEAGWDVTVLIDDEETATFPTDATGEFAQFLSIEISDQPRVLRLSSKSPETGEVLASLEDVIIAPMVRVAEAAQEPKETLVEEETPAEVQTEDQTEPEAEIAKATQAQPEEEALAQTEPTQEAPAPEQDEARETTATETETAEASTQNAPEPQVDTTLGAAKDAEEQTTAVLLSDEDGVRVIQPPVPANTAPEVMSAVALDTITYSVEGNVQLSGRGQGQAFVRVYLDNTPVTSSRIEEDGNWRSELPEVDTGVYTLRIDEVDDDGNVTSRVETPFKRENQDVLAQTEGGGDVSAITVQKGSTLWAISRERYGEGTAYVRIFEANRDRIRDPDLIYPGQVFNLPQ